MSSSQIISWQDASILVIDDDDLLFLVVPVKIAVALEASLDELADPFPAHHLLRLEEWMLVLVPYPELHLPDT